jgi:hypothetical protein
LPLGRDAGPQAPRTRPHRPLGQPLSGPAPSRGPGCR